MIQYNDDSWCAQVERYCLIGYYLEEYKFQGLF